MLVNETFLAPPESESAAKLSEEMRLYLPQQAVRQDDGGSFVWLADQSEKRARKTPVKTSAVQNDGLVEVQGGVNESSRVIIDGAEGLRDGDRIETSE
jgi:multidrug efflux pump subunit AcrA (membrane-fusion protein)